jgi:hypothetical protein
MNAIASFDPNAANHRRRSTLSPRDRRPSLQGRVAPAKRAIHPLLVGKFRACDALLRRMNRFSPLFDGAFGARRRHLDRIGETFDTLRDGASTVPPEKLALALTLYDVEEDVRLGVLDALAGEARGGVDEATLAVAADVAQATEKARSLALKVRERVGGDARMKSGYFKLAQFIVSTIVMLCLVSAQSGFGVERSNLYQALMGAMFGLTGSVAGSFVDISTRVSDPHMALQWMETYILDPIFAGEACGDGTCQSPEEQPIFQASTEARSFGASCRADCGVAPTRNARVEFNDPTKLYFAYKHMEAARAYGWRGADASRWGASDLVPVAGWNVCTTDRPQFGLDEDQVCVFDGDVVIEGRSYRSYELDVDQPTSFGESYDLELFDGAWEVRVAYDNFAWPAVPETTSGTPCPAKTSLARSHRSRFD